MQRTKGFTMVELLVVLIILAILVAVAAPMYFSNVNRSRASEAVAAMGLIRQSIRDYRISHSAYTYPTFSASNTVTAGIAAPFETGVDVNVGVTQYFSNGAYSLDSGASELTAEPFNTVNALNFVITANGNLQTNVPCGSGTPDNCAMKADDVKAAGSQIVLKMDNSGTVWVNYDNGATGKWSKY
jgi:prepilin-type N-terminal cleavage/methylation domain-containing protein